MTPHSEHDVLARGYQPGCDLCRLELGIVTHRLMQRDVAPFTPIDFVELIRLELEIVRSERRIERLTALLDHHGYVEASVSTVLASAEAANGEIGRGVGDGGKPFSPSFSGAFPVEASR